MGITIFITNKNVWYNCQWDNRNSIELDVSKYKQWYDNENRLHIIQGPYIKKDETVKLRKLMALCITKQSSKRNSNRYELTKIAALHIPDMVEAQNNIIGMNIWALNLHLNLREFRNCPI